jgi:hypothetical protein
MIYLVVLNLSLGLLSIASVNILSSLWAPAALAWKVVLIVGLLFIIIGGTILVRIAMVFQTMDRVFQSAMALTGFFIGETLAFLGVVWVILSIKKLFN